ncbi:MAG: glutamine synthetase family protein [Geminicoccaceae bacterium]|nr:glutamine synthetase family protein [Geminicoccaceae bacterium]MDW8370798.1 glutamine synthetase family protein [Geminicoccaceae bacterium]
MASAGRLSIEDLAREAREGTIDTVVCAFTDMQGRLVGKRMTARHFLEVGHEEWHACDYLLTVDMEMEPVPGFRAASWDRGYGDFVVKPDLATLRRTPWLPGTALVLGDVVDHHGRELPHAPRSILKRQLARLRAHGLVAKMASELEFYVFEEDFRTARDRRYQDLKTAGWYIEDYHILETTKREPLMRALRNALEGAGIPVQESKGEWGPGQEELNVVYAPALEMADRHVILKNAVKEVAFLQGRSVTFMAKWRPDLAGSSCHVHLSLWTEEGDRPAFVDREDPEGVSTLFRRSLAGMLAVAAEATLFLAPNVNSYKRFQAGSFAPTRIVWSRDNRTAGFRILGHGRSTRIECRIPGADVNPYLAYAALIAGALHGIEAGLEPPPAFSGDAYKDAAVPSVPRTLGEAIARLEGSSVLREAMGEEVIEHYLHAARWEQGCFERAVTDWELIRYFERG